MFYLVSFHLFSPLGLYSNCFINHWVYPAVTALYASIVIYFPLTWIKLQVI